MVRRLKKLFPSKMVHKFAVAAIIALTKNTCEGENRSAIESMAKRKVPIINPNCTAEVRFGKAVSANSKFLIRSARIALLANQRDVEQNCARTIKKIMPLWFFMKG